MSSDKVHQCQHCGKYSSKTAKYSGPSNPGGTGSADEGEEPGGSDGGTYDMEPNGGNDNDNLPVESKENEAAQIANRRADPTTRARAAVKARLKAFEKRDGGKR